MRKLTAAICTFNRAGRLHNLVRHLRRQQCPIPWEILFVDNNSADETHSILRDLSQEDGVPLRFVREESQGITYARNRALSEALESDYLFFMDDDELPSPGILKAAYDALEREEADCVGGQVSIAFPPERRPDWLVDELLGFLAETNHGSQPFWISDISVPIWTSNIAYRMSIFRENPKLRFDHRYNRAGAGVGGGEDVIMFREFVSRGLRIRYRPDMNVTHHVEEWRLKRRYFLRLHYITGRKYGQYELDEFPKTILGVPPFLFSQAVQQSSKAAFKVLSRDCHALRQAMTAAHAFGTIRGCYLKWRNNRP